jgi:hypothetical protein
MNELEEKYLIIYFINNKTYHIYNALILRRQPREQDLKIINIF